MYVFKIFGSISIGLGIVALICLPDQPSTAKFLTEAEKVIAAKRVSANRQGIKNRHFKSYQVWQAVQDPKTYILFVMAVGAQIPNAAITQFTSLAIKSFNVWARGSVPSNSWCAVQFLSLLGGGFSSARGGPIFVAGPWSLPIQSALSVLVSSFNCLTARNGDDWSVSSYASSKVSASL